MTHPLALHCRLPYEGLLRKALAPHMEVLAEHGQLPAKLPVQALSDAQRVAAAAVLEALEKYWRGLLDFAGQVGVGGVSWWRVVLCLVVVVVVVVEFFCWHLVVVVVFCWCLVVVVVVVVVFLWRLLRQRASVCNTIASRRHPSTRTLWN